MLFRHAMLVLVIALILATLSDNAPAQESQDAGWVNISDPVLRSLEQEGKKTDWPGGSAGVVVDRHSGDLYMIVAGQGVWKSTDTGNTFTRCDGGKVGGRCETAYALQVDPAGKRIACFMLDGKCAWTGDAGETWHAFADVGRNWDFAAVDWTGEKLGTIFAGLHESGGQVMLSTDGGLSWKKLFKDPEFDKTGGVGVFDDKHLVYTQKGKGIQISHDGGALWTQISEYEPIGRVVQLHDGVGYWLAKEGLLVSKDKGKTWRVQGTPVEASIGPMIDPKDAQHMVVAGVKGVLRTTDGGQTWKTIATLPPGSDIPKPGWYSNVAWDPIHDVLYVSKMGKPAYRRELTKAK